MLTIYKSVVIQVPKKFNKEEYKEIFYGYYTSKEKAFEEAESNCKNLEKMNTKNNYYIDIQEIFVYN